MKNFKLVFLSAALLALGACSTDLEDSVTSVSYTTVNLITPLDGGESFASKGSYNFNLNLSRFTGSVSTTSLLIDNKNYSVTTDTVPIKSATYENGMIIRMQNLSGYVDGNKESMLRDCNFDITSLYFTAQTTVPGYSQYPSPYPYIIGQYTTDNWKVATFQEDASYAGTTTTTYPDADGVQENYETQDMLYRVIIDLDKKTADVIIYSAKFAPASPTLQGVLLKELPVKWLDGAYMIEDADVIPFVPEGNEWGEVPRFVFNRFTLTTLNKTLTQVAISYDVAGRYHGDFTGSCVVEIQ